MRKIITTTAILGFLFIGCGENNNIDKDTTNDVLSTLFDSTKKVENIDKDTNSTNLMKITNIGYSDKKIIDDTLAQIKSKGERVINTLLTSNKAIYGEYESIYYKYIYKLKVGDGDRMGIFIISKIYNRNYSVIQKLNIQEGFVILIDGHASPKVLFAGNLSAPIANAGADKTVTVNESVTLYGSGIDSDGSIISYEWKKGSQVLGAESKLIYTPTKVGTDILTLEVMDDDGLVDTNSMKLTVKKETCDALSILLGACSD